MRRAILLIIVLFTFILYSCDKSSSDSNTTPIQNNGTITTDAEQYKIKYGNAVYNSTENKTYLMLSDDLIIDGKFKSGKNGLILSFEGNDNGSFNFDVNNKVTLYLDGFIYNSVNEQGELVISRYDNIGGFIQGSFTGSFKHKYTSTVINVQSGYFRGIRLENNSMVFDDNDINNPDPDPDPDPETNYELYDISYEYESDYEAELYFKRTDISSDIFNKIFNEKNLEGKVIFAPNLQNNGKNYLRLAVGYFGSNNSFPTGISIDIQEYLITHFSYSKPISILRGNKDVVCVFNDDLAEFEFEGDILFKKIPTAKNEYFELIGNGYFYDLFFKEKVGELEFRLKVKIIY